MATRSRQRARSSAGRSPRSIEPGRAPADFTVFASDPFTAPPENLTGTGIWMTALGGEVAYQTGDA